IELTGFGSGRKSVGHAAAQLGLIRFLYISEIRSVAREQHPTNLDRGTPSRAAACGWIAVAATCTASTISLRVGGAARVGVSGRVAVGVGVGVEVLRVVGFEERVGGDEGAGGGLVLAGAQVGQGSGAVVNAADESFAASGEAGGYRPTGVAIWVEVAASEGKGGSVDSD